VHIASSADTRDTDVNVLVRGAVVVRRNRVFGCAAVLGSVGVLLALAVPSIGASATAGKTCRTHQSCAHHGTTYRVNSVRVARRIGSDFLKQTTNGLFVVVSITMTDTKNRPSTILGSNLVVRARTGDTYELSDKGIYADNAFALLENLQPKLPKTELFIYELPRSAARGAVLVISDSLTGDQAKIPLGI
jgi:hypothetical protein